MGSLTTLSPGLSATVGRYILAVYAAGALIAWRFRCGRAVGVIGILALFDRLGLPALDTPEGMSLSVLMPLILLGLGVSRDRGLLSAKGLFQVLAASAVVLVAWAVPSVWPAVPGRITGIALLPAMFSGAGGLPDLAVILFVISGAGLLTLALKRRGPVERGLVWTHVLMVMALTSDGTALQSWYLAAIGLLLGLTVLEASHALAYKDELTGLAARRSLWHDAEAAGEAFAMAMVDVDHFKRFNDRHGHEVGDQVLRMVAGHLEEVGSGGRVYRYGGEEFTVLFPGASRDEVLPVLDELRKSIAKADFSIRGFGRPVAGAKRRKTDPPKKPSKRRPKKLSVTVSIGVAERTEKLATPVAVLKAADKALYKAKKAGRNRIAK